VDSIIDMGNQNKEFLLQRDIVEVTVTRRETYRALKDLEMYMIINNPDE
jgi:hypothetical protein